MGVTQAVVVPAHRAGQESSIVGSRSVESIQANLDLFAKTGTHEVKLRPPPKSVAKPRQPFPIRARQPKARQSQPLSRAPGVQDGEELAFGVVLNRAKNQKTQEQL